MKINVYDPSNARKKLKTIVMDLMEKFNTAESHEDYFALKRALPLLSAHKDLAYNVSYNVAGSKAFALLMQENSFAKIRFDNLIYGEFSPIEYSENISFGLGVGYYEKCLHAKVFINTAVNPLILIKDLKTNALNFSEKTFSKKYAVEAFKYFKEVFDSITVEYEEF
jgi:hypothetical protein